eukprot:1730379-Amphidinium_carterae.1
MAFLSNSQQDPQSASGLRPKLCGALSAKAMKLPTPQTPKTSTNSKLRWRFTDQFTFPIEIFGCFGGFWGVGGFIKQRPQIHTHAYRLPTIGQKT